MRHLLLFAAMLASSACTRPAAPAGPDAAPRPAPAPAAAAGAAPADPGPEPEVELSHTTVEGKVRFSTARIAAGRLSQSSRVEVDALKDRFGEWSTVATGSGRALTVVVPQPSDAGGGLVLVRPRQKTTAPLPLRDLTPAALWLTPRRILIGAERTVFQLDPEASDARPTEVVTLDARVHPAKAWDLFVPRGDGVVAIDDVLFPVYAQVLAPEGDGFKAAERWYVPAQLNGSYVDAALHEGTLVLLSHGGNAFGTFQRLTRTDEKTLLDPRVHADPQPESLLIVHVGESQRRVLRPLALPGRPPPPPAPPEEPQPPSLIAGSEYTPWSGLAVVGGQVATCAGARGLLSVPLGFESSTKGTLLDVGGRCLDVVRRGNTAVVLVSTGGVLSSLVVVRADRTGTLSRAAHYPLMGTWSRLVR